MADCGCNNFPSGLGNVTFGANVGIGTPNPSDILEIAHDGDTFLNVHAITGSGQTAGIKLQRGTPTDGYNDWTIKNTYGKLYMNSSGAAGDALLIDGDTGLVNMAGSATIGYAIGTEGPANGLAVSGNVGIGIPNPQSNLHIKAPSSAALAVSTGGTDTTQARIYKLADMENLTLTSNASYNGTNWTLDDTTQNGVAVMLRGGMTRFYAIPSGTNPRNAVETVRIQADSRIGIGTQDPQARLHVLDSFMVGDLAAGSRQALEFSAATADLKVGSQTQDGNIIVRKTDGTPNIQLNGSDGSIYAGTKQIANTSGCLYA